MKQCTKYPGSEEVSLADLDHNCDVTRGQVILHEILQKYTEVK